MTRDKQKTMVRGGRKVWLLLVLIGLSAILNSIGINWGQPSGYTWYADSIAGMRTIHNTPNILGQWKFKYPRLHFMINAVVYEPFLNHWRENPLSVRDSNGKMVKQQLSYERVSTLIMVSRVITVLMSLGAVIAVFMTARLLFCDDLAAFFSGLALALTMLFVYYSHFGNVDIPATFWFSWSCYWAVKAVYQGKWRHFILMGLFCSFAVCTKDPIMGYAVGLGLAVWIAIIGKARSEGKSFLSSLLSVLNWKVFAALIVALFFFALLNDLLTTPSAFFKRLEYWIGGPGIDDYNKSFAGHWWLLLRTCRHLYYSLGWPLLTALAVSLIYCFITVRWKWVFGVLPIVTFYILIIMYGKISISRYYLPGIAGLALILGKGSSDWLQWKKNPKLIRYGVIGFVYLSSLLYCVGLDLDMVMESRYKAENWLKERVKSTDLVVALSSPTYAPRIHTLGCRYFYFDSRPQNEEKLNKIRPHANYLIVSEFEMTTFDQAFLKELLAGALGYKEVARFTNSFLGPNKTIFSFAGWPTDCPKNVSPVTIILAREPLQEM